jgi:5'(3')-deoxyribonucleotidase
LVTWDLEKLIPLPKSKVNKFFNEEGFFKHLKPFDDAIEVLTELSKQHTLELVTLHSCEGMKYKRKFIEENLPMFHKITIYPLGDKFDKSMCKADMCVDDRLDCLSSIDAPYKVLYGLTDWNKHNIKYSRVFNWLELDEHISEIVELEKLF